MYLRMGDGYVTLTKEIQPRDLFVIRKVKVCSQAQTDGTGSVFGRRQQERITFESAIMAKSWRFDFDAKNRLQLIQNLMAHEGSAKCFKYLDFI
jgi:hypothetical protein